MTVCYVVTFEFEGRAPLTHRGTVAASSGATCVARATKAVLLGAVLGAVLTLLAGRHRERN